MSRQEQQEGVKLLCNECMRLSELPRWQIRHIFRVGRLPYCPYCQENGKKVRLCIPTLQRQTEELSKCQSTKTALSKRKSPYSR